MYSTYTDVNGEDGFVWSVIDDTGSATIDEETGKLTGVTVGTVTVQAKYIPNNYQEWVAECTVNVILLGEGTYFLKNRGTLKYMQPDNDGASHMEQHDFGGDSIQRWRLLHYGGSYYYLVNDATNKYLTAPDSSTSGASITEESYNSSIQTRQLWSISKISGQDSYKIQSLNRVGTNLVLAVGWGANWNGINIEQREFNEDTNFKDEWRFTKIQYSAIVFTYYDMGYLIRYGESASVAASKIDSYMNSVALQYLRLFGLELTINAATYYQSPLDICKGTVSDNNIDTMCSHDGVIHSERSNVISDFNTTHAGYPKTTYALWSCHKIVSTAADGDLEYNRSCSFGTGIFLINISTTNRDRDSKGILMHELNHQFGARDHYHEPTVKNKDETCKFKDICSKCGDNKRPPSCIMNQSEIDITKDNVICAECQNEILTYLKEHHLK